MQEAGKKAPLDRAFICTWLYTTDVSSSWWRSGQLPSTCVWSPWRCTWRHWSGEHTETCEAEYIAVLMMNLSLSYSDGEYFKIHVFKIVF